MTMSSRQTMMCVFLVGLTFAIRAVTHSLPRSMGDACAERLDDDELSAFIGGACANTGCSGTATCDPKASSGNGSACTLTTTCSSVNGVCQMIQEVNGAVCGTFNGYQNCSVSTGSLMCANIITGMPMGGNCTCTNHSGATCGSLQTMCSADFCNGSN